MDKDRAQLFDVRVVERNIKLGTITQEDYDRWLESLEDSAELAETSATVFTHSRYVEITPNLLDDPTDEEEQG
jgi:hypothetical protein